MGCPSPIIDQEARLVALLAAVETYTLSDDRLVLVAPDGVLVFAPAASP